MNYIVLDLEWNQCPSGKSKENPLLPFEIVEIGAVRLNDRKKITGTFNRNVSPRIYRQLHYITRDIIKTTMKELDKGKSFPETVREFFDWCAEDGDYIFCTWGPSDLTELQRNCDFFGVEHTFPFPFVFYDLQKSFSLCYDDGKSRMSLEAATQRLAIPENLTYHSAFGDARYTAQIFQAMDFDKVSIYTSVDNYRIPASSKEEFTLNFGNYTKFVSQGYDDKEKLIANNNLRVTRCPACGETLRKKIHWFSGNQKQYYCVASCPEHGFVKGRIKVKKTPEGLFYAVRIVKLTDNEGVAKIKEKQLDARRKRRERRHKTKSNES